MSAPIHISTDARGQSPEVGSPTRAEGLCFVFGELLRWYKVFLIPIFPSSPQYLPSLDSAPSTETLRSSRNTLRHNPSSSANTTRLEIRSSSTPDLNGMSLSQRYALMAQDLRSSLPSTCPWLGSEDVDLISERPISAGGFANLYEATHNDRKVALKSYRCYTSFDIAQVIAVRYNHSMC